MKKKSSPLLQLFLRLLCVLITVLIQLPAVSLGFERKTFSSPNTELYHTNAALDFGSPTGDSKTVAAPAATFSNPTAITIADRAGSATPNGISSPYPSVIAVSGLSGTVTDVNVTITGLTTARERDLNFALVSPSGQTLMLMADAGDLAGTSNVNLTFDDSAASLVSNTVITSGTYRPTDYQFSGTDSDDFPSPGPGSVNSPAPEGTATLASVFNGISPNGNWNLYIVDDSLGGGTSTVSGGWSINLTAGSAAATTTSLTSNLNPAQTGQTITFTSTTTQTTGGAPVNAGTVSFTNNGAAIAGCTAVAVNASGVATCSTTSPQGTRTIAATYSGTASFGTSTATLTQIVNSPTVVSGSQFCNNGGVTVIDGGAADVYPANIVVSGLVGTISKVTTQVNGFTAARPSNLDVQLVGPTSAAFQFMSDGGDAVNAVSNINLTFDDAAASQLPNGTALSGGTYRPTDYNAAGETDPYPAPAPSTFSRPASAGTATFASVYNGTNPNGTWSIYAVDDGIGGGNNTISGLCLNFTLDKFTTTTTVTSSANPSQQGQSVTFTATVTTGGTGTPSGTVQFFDGATSLGTATLNASGKATLTVSNLPAGTRNITAQYSGANVGAGNGGYAVSTSGGFSQVVLVATAATVNVGGRVLMGSNEAVARATVTLTDGNGNVRYAVTNRLGYYRFTEVVVGESYVIAAQAKNIQFTPKIMIVNEEIDDLNFVAH